ncbi:MAG: cell wall anchor protein, partial [Bacteroidales bacterium]
MKKVYKRMLLGGMLFTSVAAGAQVNVTAAMDSASILIGDQTRIHLEATQGINDRVQFPVLSDTIVTGIEVLSVMPPDTVRLSDDRFTVKQDILITSFDSALYYMPPFR